MRPSEYIDRSSSEVTQDTRVLEDGPKDPSYVPHFVEINILTLLRDVALGPGNFPSSSNSEISNSSILISLLSTVVPSHPAGLVAGENLTIPLPDLTFDEGQVSSPSCSQNGSQDGIHKIRVPDLALDNDQAHSPSFIQNDTLDGIDQPPKINREHLSPPADSEWAVSSEKAHLLANETITTNEERLDLDVIVQKSPLSILPRNMNQKMVRDQVADNYLDASLYPTAIQNTNPTFANRTNVPSTKPLFFPEWLPTNAPSSSKASQESVPPRPSFASSVHANSTFSSLTPVDGSSRLKTQPSSPPSCTPLPTFAVTSVGVSDMRPLKKAKLIEDSEISDESNGLNITNGPTVKDKTSITKERHATSSSPESVSPEVASANASPAVFSIGSYRFARKPRCNDRARNPESRKLDGVAVIDLTTDEDCSITPETENPWSPRTPHTPPAAKLTPEPSLPDPAFDTYSASPQNSARHHEPETPTIDGNSDSSQIFVDYDPFYDTLRVIGFINFANE